MSQHPFVEDVMANKWELLKQYLEYNSRPIDEDLREIEDILPPGWLDGMIRERAFAGYTLMYMQHLERGIDLELLLGHKDTIDNL